MDIDKLLDCPFCGHETTLNNAENEYLEMGYYVQCEGCGASSDWYAKPEYAVDWWNKRYVPATVLERAPVDALLPAAVQRLQASLDTHPYVGADEINTFVSRADLSIVLTSIRQLAAAEAKLRAERDQAQTSRDAWCKQVVTATSDYEDIAARLAATEAELDAALAALEKIDKLSASWEGRAEVPFWNLGDIARAARKRCKRAQL